MSLNFLDDRSHEVSDVITLETKPRNKLIKLFLKERVLTSHSVSLKEKSVCK